MSRTTVSAAFAAIIAGVCALPAEAQRATQTQGQLTPRSAPQERMTARQFRRLEVSGDEVEANVRTLLKRLRWHSSLSSALGSARANNKPVVLIQALGDLDGFL